VSLSTASALPLNVNFATANGSATAGQDYVSSSGTLNFAAGETQKQITVRVTADILPEPNETFEVRLSNPSANLALPPRAGLGTIIDDDVIRTIPTLGWLGLLSLIAALMWTGLRRR
jgi:Calx-beta domain